MAVKGKYEVAMVKFIQGCNTTKLYGFALFDNTIQKGDAVLVDTANGFGVGIVEDVVSQDNYSGATITREVVCSVNLDDFNNRKIKRARKESIKKKMDKLVKENQELVLYEMLAAQNPEMSEMLNEYKTLLGV